jgi:hypothetical protein
LWLPKNTFALQEKNSKFRKNMVLSCGAEAGIFFSTTIVQSCYISGSPSRLMTTVVELFVVVPTLRFSCALRLF